MVLMVSYTLNAHRLYVLINARHVFNRSVFEKRLKSHVGGAALQRLKRITML